MAVESSSEANQKSRPVGEGLFYWPSENPALLGSRCGDCGRATFPAQSSCPACCSTNVSVETLPNRGTLWTWTIQRFMPKTPYNSGESQETFQPYGVGYVELAGGVRVEGRLLENDPAKLRIGMPMDVVFYPFREDEDGTTVINFGFRPTQVSEEAA
ncbi:MAG: Zn-ribbon domain-containing OB-fold protein [Pseudomonadota bacterium]